MQTLNLRSTLCVLAFALCGLGVVGCAPAASESVDAPAALSEALAESAQALSCPAPIPPALAVPRGTSLAFSLEGRGTQNYACEQTSDGRYAWTFLEPEATLYGPFGRLAGYHYAGPTWEANDGSTVVATKLAAQTVDVTAIPWLLLQATSHAGQGRMIKISYVQRLETVGGLAPTSGCDAAHVGATADIPYSAKYSFYR